jgi:peroxin-11B
MPSDYLTHQLNAHGVLKLENIKTINTNAARFWLTGLLFAVTADLYRLRNNLQRVALLEKCGEKVLEKDNDLKKELTGLKSEQSKIFFELVQDSLDLIIPGSILQYVPVSNGIVGLAGTITSLMGVYGAWPKS